jgi:energy-coupling factor transporter ATP-binding protein EcfA2
LYLKSLTLRGFKSFASATSLKLEPGITCVVGPNGSGKSNIVDALSWVMGEQGAKSLRGGKMEDVVFAGTTSRPPLGRAEVTLTIDNTDGALPIEYAEVTISRLMFRSGQSEYAINGDHCRLLDVQELLSDSGLGREMHVIVGQGQLDDILHSGPEARRALIEEAAGVLKHRKRKEKALRKLEAMQANLTRLVDLTAELSRRLKPLGRQAEVARRAAVIQAELRSPASCTRMRPTRPRSSPNGPPLTGSSRMRGPRRPSWTRSRSRPRRSWPGRRRPGSRSPRSPSGCAACRTSPPSGTASSRRRVTPSARAATPTSSTARPRSCAKRKKS